jgi:uncharacterized protein (TIGR01777 family)
MPDFTASKAFDYPCHDLFRYHDSPGAIDRLIPPWENVQVARRSDSLEIGSEVELTQRVFGIRQTWLARHTALERDRSFEDTQVSGPFARWVHRHEFEHIDENRSILHDRIEYALPLAPCSNVADPWIRAKLRAMFAFRHRITGDDLRAIKSLATRSEELGHVPRIAVTGATGLVGRRVVELASVCGWQIVRIARSESRREQRPFPRSVETVVWDGNPDSTPASLCGLDAVIHLAGYGIAEKKWTEEVKRKIWASRVDGTQRLVEGLRRLPTPPMRLVSASGIGIFGDRGETICTEEMQAGRGFLSDLATAWESATRGFSTSAQCVVQARLGIVLHPRHGALAPMLTPAKLGMGGPIGGGRQYWPWVHIDDAANILLHLSIAKGVAGPYHVVAPQSVQQREFAATLGRVLRRPSFFPTPAWLMRFALGAMAGPLLLASARAATPKLLASGYRFRFPDLQDALRNLLGADS